MQQQGHYGAPPHQHHHQYAVPQQQYGGYSNVPSQPTSYSRPQVGGGASSYSAPYGHQQQQYAPPQQQQQQQHGQPRYSRPQQPPANSQPGRGQYNKRGFEF